MTNTKQTRGSGIRRSGAIMAAVAAMLTLASCGGGHDDGGPVAPPAAVSNTPPDSASASVLGFIAFLKILVPTQPETTDPLDVTAFVAPTTETGDPDPSI